MEHYVDIILRPDPEFVPAIILNTLFGRLHRALANLGATDIGVSFPAASTRPRQMGDRLRLHGTRQRLQELLKDRWWGALDDYVDVEPIATAPSTAEQVAVRRIQVKSNPERLRRRLARRRGITIEEARKAIPDGAARSVELPFLQLHSATTGERFKLFIRQERTEQPSGGAFNAFGLSRDATLPWF